MQYTDLQQYQQQQQAIKDLQKYHDPEHLWECILAFQGYEFQTVSGLPFTYQLKKGRNGELTKELWIDRRKNSKSLDVEFCDESVLKRQTGKPMVPRPKAWGYSWSFLSLWNVLSVRFDLKFLQNTRI